MDVKSWITDNCASEMSFPECDEQHAKRKTRKRKTRRNDASYLCPSAVKSSFNINYKIDDTRKVHARTVEMEDSFEGAVREIAEFCCNNDTERSIWIDEMLALEKTPMFQLLLEPDVVSCMDLTATLKDSLNINEAQIRKRPDSFVNMMVSRHPVSKHNVLNPKNYAENIRDMVQTVKRGTINILCGWYQLLYGQAKSDYPNQEGEKLDMYLSEKHEAMQKILCSLSSLAGCVDKLNGTAKSSFYMPPKRCEYTPEGAACDLVTVIPDLELCYLFDPSNTEDETYRFGPSLVLMPRIQVKLYGPVTKISTTEHSSSAGASCTDQPDDDSEDEEYVPKKDGGVNANVEHFFPPELRGSHCKHQLAGQHLLQLLGMSIRVKDRLTIADKVFTTCIGLFVQDDHIFLTKLVAHPSYYTQIVPLLFEDAPVPREMADFVVSWKFLDLGKHFHRVALIAFFKTYCSNNVNLVSC